MNTQEKGTGTASDTATTNADAATEKPTATSPVQAAAVHSATAGETTAGAQIALSGECAREDVEVTSTPTFLSFIKPGFWD